jgi:S-DNA-T family DNA segregation ATPase FtsK/SpoIIIE
MASDRYRLPPLELLEPWPSIPPDRAALERDARLLESVLDDFQVTGSITHVRPGPVMTTYKFQPAPGTRASQVSSLADDIARHMSAISARVAAIPGETAIGIELPNAQRETIGLQELIGSQCFEDQDGLLRLALGKTVAGDPVITDLASMPHLLVAGMTGSGKSVGLNCMILSLLYGLSPDQCRMIMIDAGMVEFGPYEDIPHLLSPVVTNSAEAARVLAWAVEQMEDRYRTMTSLGVRNLGGFNDKVRAAEASADTGQAGCHSDGAQPLAENKGFGVLPQPRIVIVIDEVGELIMAAGNEITSPIQRLAQKGGDAGIHMILATDRPSADLISGAIMANMRARISFKVISSRESMITLDAAGAEELSDPGDMLFKPPHSAIIRVHGALATDDEVRAVADHWRAQERPDYPTRAARPGDTESSDGSAEDDLYRQAVELVVTHRKASTSWLQRQLRVGYNTAARLIERMEKDGIVGRPDHVGRRGVLNGEAPKKRGWLARLLG